jgi:hypothetical protein
VREQISVALSCPIGGNLLWWPQEINMIEGLQKKTRKRYGLGDTGQRWHLKPQDWIRSSG